MDWTKYENYASGLDDASEIAVRKWDNQYENQVEKQAWGERINYELSQPPVIPRGH